MNGQLSLCMSPLMAETMACRETLTWLKGREVLSVRLQYDCMDLCHNLTSSTSGFRSYIGIPTSDCKSLMASFTFCFISFIPCSSQFFSTLFSL